MILIIMRHGDAVAYQEPDNTRALTEYGRQQSKTAGKRLKENLASLTADTDCAVHNISMALVSPYLRTQQTYTALAEEIIVEQHVTLDLVTPMGNVMQCVDVIHAYASGDNPPKALLVVTHLPLVSLLADKVCSGFNGKIFDSADLLVINYNSETGIGTQLAYFES